MQTLREGHRDEVDAAGGEAGRFRDADVARAGPGFVDVESVHAAAEGETRDRSRQALRGEVGEERRGGDREDDRARALAYLADEPRERQERREEEGQREDEDVASSSAIDDRRGQLRVVVVVVVGFRVIRATTTGAARHFC